MPHLTWLDWLLLLVVFVLVVRGGFEGAVRQCFGLLGFVAGLWAALWISQWVGRHWMDARPALIFGMLRWIVAGLGGLAVATAFQFWGEALAEAVKKGGVAPVDRAAGLVFGALIGGIVVTLVLLLALLTSWPAAVRATAAEAELAAPLMSAGARVASAPDSFFPGSGWLKRKFLDAERRARSRSPSS